MIVVVIHSPLLSKDEGDEFNPLIVEKLDRAVDPGVDLLGAEVAVSHDELDEFLSYREAGNSSNRLLTQPREQPPQVPSAHGSRPHRYPPPTDTNGAAGSRE